MSLEREREKERERERERGVNRREEKIVYQKMFVNNKNVSPLLHHQC